MRRRSAGPMWFAVGAIVTLLFLPDGGFAQCAMCRTAILASPEGQKMASALNSAILFLMGAPFFIMGTVAFLFFQAHRKANR